MRFGGMIWVVTNNRRTRHTLVPLIAAKGYTTLDLDCGDEVPRRMQFQIPSLVIIDCGMPDSFKTLAELRAQPNSHVVPVVMFSDDAPGHRERALLGGANAFVEKGTLDWAELLAEVTRFAGPPPADQADR
ncbi:MAG: response regulator [Phycisphaerales bacterium]|nr:response regulator [Phycisphaerales bacterium]